MSPDTIPKNIDVCGLKLEIRIGTNRDHPDLKDSYACYDPDQMIIWLHEDCPSHAASFWLDHEMMHAVLMLTGALDVIQAAGLPEENKDSLEEALVRVLTPTLRHAWGRQ